MTITVEAAAYLWEKRSRKNAKRRIKNRAKRLKILREHATTRQHFGEKSRIIQMIANAYKGGPANVKSALKLRVPSTFSIIDGPEEAISLIGQFAEVASRTKLRAIEIDHWELSNYDLAANALLDIIPMELRTEAILNHRRIRWTGKYPRLPEIKRFIQALGIIKHLDIEHESPKADVKKKLRVFDKRNRHYFRVDSPDRADYKTKVVGEFVDHINDCLRDHKLQLTDLSRHILCVYTGEILDNAQEHAGKVLDWTIQGYLDNSLEMPICEIAIFNFGRTIAETLQELPKTHYTRAYVQRYVDQHLRTRMFGKDWTEADLFTLVALQGHVSCKNESPADTRGNGTVDLIEFFQKMYEECSRNSKIPAQMAILSGNSHIYFDGKYRLAESLPGGPKVIAFNAANDLSQKPDAKYVKSLGPTSFPGTIISIRFPLDTKSHLLQEAQHDRN